MVRRSKSLLTSLALAAALAVALGALGGRADAAATGLVVSEPPFLTLPFLRVILEAPHGLDGPCHGSDRVAAVGGGAGGRPLALLTSDLGLLIRP